MTILNIIVALLGVTVFFLIRAEFKSNKTQIFIFKPISTLLVISIPLNAILSGRQLSLSYSFWILAALVFSLGGDIALMFQEKSGAFRVGLILFLAAHIIYSVCFNIFSGVVSVPLGLIILLAILAAVAYAVLYPNLGRMKIPVFVYILIISYMLLRALLTHGSDYFSARQAWLISTGALLFYISDLMLAINRFRWSFRYHRISLAFYYAGQLLIALSTINY